MSVNMYLLIDIVQTNFDQRKKEGTKLANLKKRVLLLRREDLPPPKSPRTKREQKIHNTMLINKKVPR